MFERIKKISAVVLASFLLIGVSHQLSAHCQVPCGIYDDQMRIKMISEHLDTIEKAMKQIVALGKESPVNYNQIVRWTVNKETHAEEIDGIVTYYFMTQRIKPADPNDKKAYAQYMERLELLHHLLVYTMKAKQSTDDTLIPTLREILKKFADAYFGPEPAHSH